MDCPGLRYVRTGAAKTGTVVASKMKAAPRGDVAGVWEAPVVRPDEHVLGPRQELQLTELHTHLGSAVSPSILWGLAHQQGFRLPTENYWEFRDMITVGSRGLDFEGYLRLFDLTEMVQSSPEAMERCAYEVVGGAFRHCNITRLELRFNPAKRTRGGERDMDQIILATCRGLERACMEYPVRAGLIFSLDKSFPLTLNEVIVRKAIRYRARQVVGIDLAGSEPPQGFDFEPYAPLFDTARAAGLGITVHAGESGSAAAMRQAVLALRPTRVGHGVKAVEDEGLLRLLADLEMTLEICPSSNLSLGIVSSLAELAGILATFRRAGVRYCINTDGPEMIGSDLRAEYAMLMRAGILTLGDVRRCNEWASEASFIEPLA